MKAARHMRFGSRRVTVSWRHVTGLLATVAMPVAIAALSLASSACIAEAQSADAPDITGESSPIAESHGIKGVNPELTTLGISGAGSSSGDRGSPPVVGPNGGPVPSPWQPSPTPGDPSSGGVSQTNENGVDPGTVDSPVPSPWMTPPSTGQVETTSSSEHSAPEPRTHTE
jgi:hypothetical protein